MNGYVTGGWGFVIAAYSLTAVVLTVYGISIASRLRSARRSSEES